VPAPRPAPAQQRHDDGGDLLSQLTDTLTEVGGRLSDAIRVNPCHTVLRAALEVCGVARCIGSAGRFIFRQLADADTATEIGRTVYEVPDPIAQASATVV